MKLLIQRFFLSILIFLPLLLIAQSGHSPELTDSLSWVTVNPKLNEAVEKLKDTNSAKQTIPGYRIQIYFGSQRSKANEMRARFVNIFPDVNATVSYQQPNFKVRAGDFRTRMEAQSNLEIIEKEFQGAFVVPDEIQLPPLK